jgi:Cu-processing system ATP-binding protein
MMLILDEPTASLDPVSSDKLRKKITDSLGRGRLVLISSHVLSELDDLATHVAYLMNGRLVFFREIEALRSETGEHRLSRIVPVLLEKEEVYHD